MSLEQNGEDECEDDQCGIPHPRVDGYSKYGRLCVCVCACVSVPVCKVINNNYAVKQFCLLLYTIC